MIVRKAVTMIISSDILEKTCKDMIETILCCLPDATKGTIYRVGPLPELQVVRVTTGVKKEPGDEIHWGLAETSDYNYPGKVWEQYRDHPFRVKEAMAWCIERQKSWTADNPAEDIRSVRKQVSGELEDFHHMEPVLVRKASIFGSPSDEPVSPLNSSENPIWQDSEFVVVAVIKIYFKPYSIRLGDRSTKIIKKLSRNLGTEMLSLHVRETLSDARKELAKQRLQSCNVLAHELRNTLIKLGFIFSAINAEISFLREQWEAQIEKAFPELDTKKSILGKLSGLAERKLKDLNDSGELTRLCTDLLNEQKEFAELALMPQLGKKWLDNKIGPKWHDLLWKSHAWDGDREEIERLLKSLELALWSGMNADLAGRMEHLPPELRAQWPALAYTDFTADKVGVLDQIIEFLKHPELQIPHKMQTRRILISLKALVEMIPEVEERANRIICALRYGDCSEGLPVS